VKAEKASSRATVLTGSLNVPLATDSASRPAVLARKVASTDQASQAACLCTRSPRLLQRSGGRSPAAGGPSYPAPVPGSLRRGR
jgi:hypothetical protein